MKWVIRVVYKNKMRAKFEFDNPYLMINALKILNDCEDFDVTSYTNFNYEGAY